MRSAFRAVLPVLMLALSGARYASAQEPSQAWEDETPHEVIIINRQDSYARAAHMLPLHLVVYVLSGLTAGPGK